MVCTSSVNRTAEDHIHCERCFPPDCGVTECPFSFCDVGQNVERLSPLRG
eukprot:m.470195 g.470195  ORF g.470195 m.470195 type:complete len:50 (+) comp29495_c0_seq1:2375-2524(+)